jgi:uroporphyrin-III C-methyltransferase
MTGKVYIVGAGPGDPELLTVKAVRVLRTADVVLHDSLVGAAILELIPPPAKVVSVGKRCGRKLLTQDDINRLLIHHASKAVTVVRLKGGDPLVFGRGGEEMDALRAVGIHFEVVPGVTSALAAAASAGISLTDRRIASHVLFTTAHRRTGELSLDLGGLAWPDTTIVVYMPGSDYGPIADAAIVSGLSSNTPCIVVSSASLPGQQIFRTTLRQLATAGALAAPALLIIGNAVGAPMEELVPQFWHQLASTTAGETSVNAEPNGISIVRRPS